LIKKLTRYFDGREIDGIKIGLYKGNKNTERISGQYYVKKYHIVLGIFLRFSADSATE